MLTSSQAGENYSIFFTLKIVIVCSSKVTTIAISMTDWKSQPIVRQYGNDLRSSAASHLEHDYSIRMVYIFNLFITLGISKLALYQGVDFLQKVIVVWN